MNNQTTRNRRSESLTKDEHKAFIKHYKSFPTKLDAEPVYGLTRQVMDLVAIKGSGSPETVEKIRAGLSELEPVKV